VQNGRISTPLLVGWGALGAAIGVFAVAGGGLRKPVTRVGRCLLNVLLLVSVFAVGWGRARTWSGAVPSFGSYGSSAGITYQPAEELGTVASDPELQPGRTEGRVVCRFLFRAEKSGLIQVVCSGAVGQRFPAYGERWLLKGRIGEPDGGRQGEGAWDGGQCTFWVDLWRSRFISAGHGSWIKHRCLEIRRAAARQLARGIEDDSRVVGILRGLLLGYRWEVEKGVRDMMVATGILHILAISGTHVAVIAMFFQVLLRSLRISRDRWFFLLAPVLATYTIATGAAPSAVRACIMAILYHLAPAIGRRGETSCATALAALVIVWWNPSQLFTPGFVMSFVVVLGLIILWPLGRSLIVMMWRTVLPCEEFPSDLPGMLTVPEPMTRWKIVVWRLKSLLDRTVSLFAFSCAAWLASAPLSAFFFGKVSLVSVVSNMVAIPLAFLAMLSGCLSMTLGPCVDWLGEVFNNAALLFVRVLVAITGWLARIPFAVVKTGRPSLFAVGVWYLVLGLVAFGVKEKLAAAGRKELIERQESDWLKEG
ncbi:MAG: ComEC family competence protein, partial [Kiritimatiellae bacterium]|nr:ComEC family competence protein [Kiritimatiellia bacterium]